MPGKLVQGRIVDSSLNLRQMRAAGREQRPIRMQTARSFSLGAILPVPALELASCYALRLSGSMHCFECTSNVLRFCTATTSRCHGNITQADRLAHQRTL